MEVDATGRTASGKTSSKQSSAKEKTELGWGQAGSSEEIEKGNGDDESANHRCANTSKFAVPTPVKSLRKMEEGRARQISKSAGQVKGERAVKFRARLT